MQLQHGDVESHHSTAPSFIMNIGLSFSTLVTSIFDERGSLCSLLSQLSVRLANSEWVACAFESGGQAGFDFEHSDDSGTFGDATLRIACSAELERILTTNNEKNRNYCTN